MDKRKSIGLLVSGALMLALALGAFTIRSVYAQEATPTPPDPAQQLPERGPRGGIRGGYMDEDLAAALGIEVADLQAARQTAFTGAVQQAVEAGLLTQEQADQLSERGGEGFHFGGKGFPRDSGIDLDALLADALGVSTDQLDAARQEALTTALDRAVAEGSITQEQADLAKGYNALANDDTFQSAMQSAFESAVQQAVSSGVITQAQADQILANQAGRGFLGQGGFGGPMSGKHHHGQPGGEFPTNPSGTDTDI